MKRLACLLVLLLTSCSPPAQAPAPGKPAAPVSQPQTAYLAWQTGSDGVLPLDSAHWFQEYVAAGGQPNPAWTAHPVTTKDCPVGAICEMLPDHASGRYASYLLFPISATYSTTTADPTPHYFDASGYKSLTVKLRIVGTPNVQFMHDSEPNNDVAHGCPTPAHIRPFLAHQQGTLESWTWRWFAHYVANTNAGALDAGGILLEPGVSVALSWPLTQDHWVSVYPGKDPAAEKLGWETMIHNVSNFGLVMGGGCAYAHGVNCTGGPCELQVTSFELTK